MNYDPIDTNTRPAIYPAALSYTHTHREVVLSQKHRSTALTLAHAQTILYKFQGYPIGVPARQCVRSAPLGTPRTASRVRGSGRRRRAEARLLLAGVNTLEDGLGAIHCCRLGDLLRVMCDEGGRARSRATVPRTIIRAVPLGSVS